MSAADKLYEIYTDDSGAFSVGMIHAQNSEDILFRGVDEEGKVSAYYAMPRKAILSMEEDTEYLARISAYMDYAAEHPYSAWYSLPDLEIDPEKPILSQILRLAAKDGELVSMGRVGDEEIICGYVSEPAGGRVTVDCVDPASAMDLPQVRIRIRDLEYVEYGSLANRLLMYANKKLGGR